MAIRELQNAVLPWLARNIDLGGRRMTNAGDSIGPTDYVTRLELDVDLKKVDDRIIAFTTEALPTALTLVKSVRVGSFATRGSPIAHAQELFVASDRNYVGWVSDGTAWKYAFGVQRTTLAGLQTGLVTDDAGYLDYTSDYEHLHRWTGSAWEFAPGDDGSDYFGFFRDVPTKGVWQICDGTAVDVCTGVGGTNNITTPDFSTAAYLKAATSYATPAAASGVTTSVSGGTPAGTIGAIAATGTAAVQRTDTGLDTAAQDHTHPAPTFTGDALAGHTHGPATLELRNTLMKVYLRR